MAFSKETTPEIPTVAVGRAVMGNGAIYVLVIGVILAITVMFLAVKVFN